MPQAIWTKIAEDDLAEIAYYIAVEDRRPEVAERIVEEIRTAANQFAAQALAGHRHPEVRQDSLYRRFKRWLVFYQPTDGGIVVVRVVDGSRDLPSIV